MNKFDKNSNFIKNLFNSISPNYDKLNDIMSFGLHRKIKKKLIQKLKIKQPNNLVCLDLCSGTGDIASLLKAEFPQSKVIGIDFSEKMLEIARKKHPDIEFLEADCTNLPFKNESFDVCTIAFGLRNIEEMEKALSEIYRILKPGGIFINLDLSKPNKFFNLFLKPYMYLWISLLGKIFHGDKTPYKYLAISNETFPSPNELVEIYRKIGFFETKNKNYLFGQIASQTSVKIPFEHPTCS